MGADERLRTIRHKILTITITYGLEYVLRRLKFRVENICASISYGLRKNRKKYDMFGTRAMKGKKRTEFERQKKILQYQSYRTQHTRKS